MSILRDTQGELDGLILEEFEFEPSCGGIRHSEGVKGHRPAETATHFLKCPNCNETTLVCAGRANYMRHSRSRTRCTGCEDRFEPGQYIVGRIPGK